MKKSILYLIKCLNDIAGGKKEDQNFKNEGENEEKGGKAPHRSVLENKPFSVSSDETQRVSNIILALEN
jgi:hypothetical protein